MNCFKLLSLAAVFAGLVFVSSASAQNVSVVSGNGQVLGAPSGNFLLQPLVVQVTDATTGAPVGAGVAVNWQGSGFNGFFLATAGTDHPNQVTLGTDASGQSTAIYQLPASVPTLNVTSPFIQTTVTATVTGNTAAFTLTELASAPTGIAAHILVVQSNILLGSTLSGAVGTTAPAIQFQVGASNGQSTTVLPNAAVELLNFQDPSQGPMVACASTGSSGAGLNTVLTDANGLVSCTPVFGGQPGQGEFGVTVGGVQTATSDPAGFWQALLDPTDLNSFPFIQTAWINFAPMIKINVTPGAAGKIKIISPQGTLNVTAGGGLPAPLIVEVDNTSGLPVSGSTVNWTVVSPASGVTLQAATTTSDSNGRAFDNVTVSSFVSGLVQVKATLASDATKFVTFTINVSAPITITQFQIVSGNSQSAAVNTTFGQALRVRVTTNVGVGANVSVQFVVLSGSISLTQPTNVPTDGDGFAQVSVFAGSVPGPASVMASVASSTGTPPVTFSLTVGLPPANITAANFVNGADLQPNSLSPCGIGALVANAGSLGIPNVSPTFPGGTVPSSTVQLAFANISAPILNIGNNAAGQQQILFQVPCDVTPGSVLVTGSIAGAAISVNLTVQPASPGVFQTQMSDGVFRAVLVRSADGSFVSLANPARQGETVVAFVTGLGPTTPLVSTHAVPIPGITATVQGHVIPGMNGGGPQLVYAQLSRDLPGIYEVAFQVPTDVPTGNDITFSVGVTPPGSSTTYYSGLSKVPVHQ